MAEVRGSAKGHREYIVTAVLGDSKVVAVVRGSAKGHRELIVAVDRGSSSEMVK